MSALRPLLLVLLPLALTAAEHPRIDPDAPGMGRLKAELARVPPHARARCEERVRALPASDADALNIDPDGELFYTCAALPVAEPTAPAPLSTGSTASTVPLSQIPILHSRPGCARAIILDFTGHTVTGTAWNSSASVPRWDAIAYDLDGQPNSFSTAELTAIRRIWERVAEDFAPFDVDVTTAEIPDSRSTIRVLITRDTDAAGRDCPGKGGGGIAYIGVFGAPQAARYAPAWVYANRLGNGRADYVAEACSHEAGHNLGLHHDGTATATYYGGHGSGEVSWAPIMGVAYGSHVSQWCCGHYAGANQGEDDVAMIAGQLGWRADDHGNVAGTATALRAGSGGAMLATGVIGARGDADAFSVVVGAGNLAINATPYRADAHTRGGNLDLTLELRDAAGTVLATAAPPGATGASLSRALAAGRYTIIVAASGEAGVYDDYASLGGYALAIASVLPVPDAIAPGAITDLVASADGPAAIVLSWTASGDDGASGTAALYAVRSAAGPIADEAGWEAATPIACTATPGPAGCAQDMRVEGLPANARRWFAIRAIDDAGNVGPFAIADATTAPPAITIADAAVATDSVGGLLAIFTVTCTPVSALPVWVAWTTRDDTARAPTDYTAAAGSLVFAPGETQRTLVVAATGGRAQPARLRMELAAAEAAALVVADAAADLPAGAGNPGSRSVIETPPPALTAGSGGGGGGGCGAGTGIALLALIAGGLTGLGGAGAGRRGRG